MTRRDFWGNGRANYQIGDIETYHLRQEAHDQRASSLNCSENLSSQESLAGAPGFEPGDGRFLGHQFVSASRLVAPCSPRGLFHEQSEFRSGYKSKIVV
jgi:hypothetical protein